MKKDLSSLSIKILHTADIHLGAPMTSFGDRAEERKELLRQTFLSVCRLAVERKVHLFIIAGDLFDSARPQTTDIDCAKEGLSILTEAKIPVSAVPGGHDGAGTFHNTLERLELPGLTVLGMQEFHAPRVLTMNDTQVNLYGMSAEPGTPLRLETMKRRNLPGFHIGLLHASVIEGDLEIPARDIPVTRNQLAALDLDYMALGHYHDFQIVETDEKTVGCYPGTIESKRFSETGPRHVALITLTEDGLHIEQVEVGQTRVEKIELRADDFENEQEATRAVQNLGGEKKLARVILTGLRDSLLDIDSILAGAFESFAYLEIIDQTEVAADTDLRTIAQEPTVRGLATARLLTRLDDASDEDDKRSVQTALKFMLHEFDRHGKGHEQ